MVPRVSVILPVFNAAPTVARAVESIRAQTLADWELIAVDDGSTDGTRRILEALTWIEPRLKLLTQAHAGVVVAANAGLAAARGELVARMDADDFSQPERLARQAEFLLAPANHAVGVVSCRVDFGGDRAVSEGYARHVDWVNTLMTPEQIALNRFVESPLANPSVMFRHALIDRHGGFREGEFPEDYELWLRWLDAGVRMAKVPEVLLRWNDSPGRISRTDGRYAPEAFFRLKAKWVAREVERIRIGASRPPDVFVWGAGRHTRLRAAHVETHGLRIVGYIDVDAKKTGRGVGGTGLPVLAESDLPPAGQIFVLGYVTSWGARDYVRDKLSSRGYVEGRDFLICA